MSVTLSSRERDCLTWAARGKSSWDIGAILEISENTVNFHIKNAMKKLRTTSRTVAAIKAMQLGIIQAPAEFDSPQSSQETFPASSGDESGASTSLGKPDAAPPYTSSPSSVDRKRIKVGVLPFLALQARRYRVLASSFTHEIAAGLAQFRWLDVIGPTPSKSERSAHFADDDLAGREFDYLVDGALWSEFNILQVRVRLLDVVDGAREMWSEHWELAPAERYQLDDRIISHIAEQLDVATLHNKRSEPE